MISVNLSATNLSDVVTYNLMLLGLPDGLRANISVRAINSIGSSNYSEPLTFMIPSRKSYRVCVDAFNTINNRKAY